MMQQSVFVLVCLVVSCINAGTTRPVIGILTQSDSDEVTQVGKEIETYIAASYVKFAESAGAMVVPVFCFSSEDELTTMFHNINGLLIPGGGQNLNDPNNCYLKAVSLFIKLSANAFDETGEVFPVWGTCLGFETIAVAVGGPSVLKSGFDSENYPISLDFTPSARTSRLFSSVTQKTFSVLGSENVTMNNHGSGVNPTDFSKSSELSSFFNVLSTNVDRKGQEFISTMEGKKYHIYAVQWHPEKNAFEWTPKEQIPHSPQAVEVTHEMATFLVNLARNSTHTYDPAQLEKDIIYQYSPTYTLPKGWSFEQCYFFNETTTQT